MLAAVIDMRKLMFEFDSRQQKNGCFFYCAGHFFYPFFQKNKATKTQITLLRQIVETSSSNQSKIL